ncbi:MAG: hypothetical protein HY551_02030 [Elusimicrobia bacterium]|nr:hypothetical protein [Elusimicrobiota bacterium]
MTKWLIGLILAPTALGAAAASLRLMGTLFSDARRTWPFLVGFAGYPLAWLYLFRAGRAYVFGHELAHAVAGWMSGARVLGFAVRDKGGHVDLSHSNIFIALAPYIVPIYAVGVVFLYRLLVWLSPPAGPWAAVAHDAFLLGMGLALGFHFLHTAEVLWARRQPDLDQAGGIFFSVVLIVLFNAVFLGLAMKCLFPGAVSVSRFAGWTWAITREAWAGLGAVVLAGWEKLLGARETFSR